MSAPALAQTLPDGSRKYIHPLTGEQVPSVTTIMKVLDKPALQGWGARVAAEYAWKNKDQLALFEERDFIAAVKSAHQTEARTAADLGTLIHEICERWGNNPVDIPKQADPYVNQFIAFLGDVKPEFVLKEVTFWNRTVGYAGTADAVAVIGKECWVIDYKTGKGVYPEYGLQLAALGAGEFSVDIDGTEYEMPPITRHAIVHLRPRSWKMIEIMQPEECFTAFQACRELWHWQTMVAPDVLAVM
jgi:hypothetical protein